MRSPRHNLQVASVLEEAWAPEYTYIGIIVDTDGIRKLQVRKLDSAPTPYVYGFLA